MDARIAGLVASCTLLGAVAAVPQKAASKPKAPAKPAAQSPTFTKDVAPVLKNVCAMCHGKGKPAGGVDLASLTTEAKALADKALLQKIAKNVASGAMPPQGMPKAQKTRFLAWIDSALAGDCDLADAGRVTIRRLNRAEYDNTVRDLLGIEFRAAADFPSDDVGYGFDNIGDVLSLSPLLMEKYMKAAEQIAEKAIVVPGPLEKRYEGDRLKPTGGGNIVEAQDWLLYTSGELRFQHEFPAAGSYRLKVRAYGHQAGPEPAKMSIALGNRRLQLVDVQAQVAQPQVYEVPFTASAGRQQVAVGFTNDFFDPKLPEGRRDRNLIVSWVEVVGPIGASSTLPASHLRLIPSVPAKERRFDAARQYLYRFASRAYRRPAKPDELDRLMTIFKAVDQMDEPFERSMQVCVQAVLVSPHFLFRVEQDPRGGTGNRL